MQKIGHFGIPALVAGGLAVVLLVLHLAVPFGVFDFPAADNDIGIEDDTITRGEMADGFDAAEGYGPAGPGVTLAGIIMAMVAGVLLVVAGFIPMPIVAARFAGWVLGLVGAVGGFMAFTSSAYWLGVGFTTLSGFLLPSADPAQRLWIISPVLVFAGAVVLIGAFAKVMTGVAAKRDGLRDQALGQMKGAFFAAAFLALALVLPWSIQVLSGDETRAQGLCDPSQTCEPSYLLFTAFGHSDSDVVRQAYTGESFGGIIGIAEATSQADPGLFQGLAFSIKVLTAAGWVGFLLGAIATIGPVLSSAFKLPAAKWSVVIQGLGLPMALWAAIMWILASTYQWRPSWDANAVFGPTLIKDFQTWAWPGTPLFVGAFIVFWALMQVRAVKTLFGERDMGEVVAGNAHTFD